jgi:ATP-dependent Clp protease ATP-binding subunit ClpC
MSSDLPSRPNFEYLKKRAKELLRELQKQNPQAKLADAQHQIAREHGFLNWSQLKDGVAALARRALTPSSAPTAGLFPRFTTRAKQATFFSRFEAGQFGHPSIDPEHLLLGVIRARHDVATQIAANAGLSLDLMRATVCERRQADTPLSTSVIVAFSDDTKRAISLAAAEADRLHHADIGTPHLLLGILSDAGSLAASMLREAGVTPDAIRSRVDEWMNEERAT